MSPIEVLRRAKVLIESGIATPGAAVLMIATIPDEPLIRTTLPFLDQAEMDIDRALAEAEE